MEKLLSIIIPIYNVEIYLDRCMESIVNQSYKNLDIIMVDDGSPDNCPIKCDEWAEKDDRIRVLHRAMAACQMPEIRVLKLQKVIIWPLLIAMTS